VIEIGNRAPDVTGPQLKQRDRLRCESGDAKFLIQEHKRDARGPGQAFTIGIDFIKLADLGLEFSIYRVQLLIDRLELFIGALKLFIR
jgi:hypothetical protein